ncbi:MAG: protein-L-isoaspartate O-methyltransferase [Rhodospirillales bacterium]|nr:protein-L-isoaspartate O-methyltransferase [Rhodospirillales bacterium]
MDFKAARRAMVESQLATNNVISESVLDAMEKVPREFFVPEQKVNISYLDEDIAVGDGRFLLEPMVFARMVQALEPTTGDVVLDVGSGSGYSSAVLSMMSQTVVAAESSESLMTHALSTWKKLAICNIADIQGDILASTPAHAPYDMILINGAVAEIPQALVDQLQPETGRMVCVLRTSPMTNGQAVLIKRSKEGPPSVRPLFDANTPYMSEFAPRERFSF